MGPRRNYACTKDATIKPGKVDNALGMGQHTKKRCSSEGCTNFARKRGVCMKHGANILDLAEI